MSGNGSDPHDEEAVRLTAYFLWEQAGRSDTNPQDFWAKALEIHERARANEEEIGAGLAWQSPAPRDPEDHDSDAPDPDGGKSD